MSSVSARAAPDSRNARKQDHGADRRMPQALAFVVGHGAALDIEHHRPGGTLYFSHSRSPCERHAALIDKETGNAEFFLFRKSSSSSLENCSTGWPDAGS